MALRNCFPSNLRRILEELPESLDETYGRILKEINNANQKQSHRLLQCLAVAIRPLRVEELADVLALDFIEGGIPKFNANWRWEHDEEAILSACSSLVSVIIDNGSRVVQFSHFSVKEFLTSNRLAFMEDVSRFRIAIEPSHVILSQACLGVFLSLDGRTNKDTVENMPLSRYAVGYWHIHARFENVESQIKDALDYFFDLDKPHFAPWIRIQGFDHLFMASSDEEPTGVLPPGAPLLVATSIGFCGLAERLIIKQPQAIQFCGTEYTSTPLHLAASQGYLEICRLLLERNADLHGRDNSGNTPLHLAASMGRLEIAHILLERDAEVNSQNDDGSTPFLRASASGSLDVAQLLLDHSANVHMQDKSGNTPLHFAASGGHLKVARMLLELNAEVNSLNDKRSTPLHLALSGWWEAHLDVTQLLLGYGADVHIHDDNGNTPLHFAASGGFLGIAQILLERDAEVDFRDNHGCTPLHHASAFGTPDVVRLLLDHNADARVRDSDGDTPLHCASFGGLLEVTRILLGLNVEVNSQNEKGSTPLHLASKGGQEGGNSDIVQLLLDHGADAQVRDHNGKIATQVARGPKQQKIKQLLSQHAVE